MDLFDRLSGRLLALLLLCAALPAFAQPREVVHTDLAPLIDEAAKSREQFAVSIPHRLTADKQGAWTTAAGVAVWRYSIEIPTAVSISFHAAKAALPANAVLSVRAGTTSYTYRPRDLHRGELWSRIARGDALELTLRVPVAARSQVKFEIDSFQAGYRGLGGGVANHPHYDQIMRESVVAANSSSCVQNYACDVTASNKPSAQATVGLVIADLYQCTGSLINNIAGDNTPYVLTARHCETGTFGGGNPGAATQVIVYWDAMSPCSQALGSLYDPGIATQSGASTIVEQQDAWLIKLDENPVVADAYLAGFDASGGAVAAGYTIQHSQGYDKQLTDWFGQAYALQMSGVLGVTYLSNFWEVVNQLGNIGPGSSGSALFDQNNRLVGSLSLGRTSTDPSGYGNCPQPTPPAPNGSNGEADFTSFAAVWNSTADTTSNTGTTTLKRVLDPAGTGSLVVNSVAAVYLSFTPSATSAAVSNSVLLTWNAPGATSCTAAGGLAGDGWSGSFAAAASRQVSETTEAEVTYVLTCQFSAGRSASAQTSVVWGSPSPQLSFTTTYAVWTTRPATLTWSSNESPCAISGGALGLSNLPASGSVTTTQSTPGNISYSITCGTAAASVTTSGTVQYVTPSMQFTANGTDRLLGQPLNLQWQSDADNCTPSGGAPNDGWATTQFAFPGTGASFSPNVTTLGTYTYTLTCTSGPMSLQQQLVVTIENGPPFVTASVDRTSVSFTETTSDYVHLSWNSNLSICYPSMTPLAGVEFIGGSDPQSVDTGEPLIPGVYQVIVTCGPINSSALVNSAPITLTVLPPAPPTATLSIAPNSVVAGQSFVLTWTSTDTMNCNGSGTLPTDLGWDPEFPSGSFSAVTQMPGTYTFKISCDSIDAAQAPGQASASLKVTPTPPPTVKVSADPAAPKMGSAFTLTWSSTYASSCSASGGGAGGANDFAGQLETSGSTTIMTEDTGTFTYTVTCTSKAGSGHASVAVKVATPTSGGSGGGGAIGVLEVLALGMLICARNRRCKLLSRKYS